MLVVEKDIARTIANVIRSHLACLQKTQTYTARMTTQLHLSSQPKKVTTCFVLNDCSDDSEVLANIAGQKYFSRRSQLYRRF